MADTSTVFNRCWRLTQSAPWRWMLFLIVVWSIAGAFVLLHSALLRIANIVTATGPALPNAAPTLINVAAASPVDHCNEVLDQWGRTHSTQKLTPEVSKYSSEFAWRMGFEVGRVAGALGAGRLSLADTQQHLEKASQMAGVLQVPAPALRKIKQSLRAPIEFAEYIESDPQCIAAQLAQNFSPKHAQLLQFGEALGFSTAYRMILPEIGNVLGPLVRRHGELAELPQPMWIGFVRETKAPLPGSNPQARLDGVMQPFHEYFSCQRENGKNCSATAGRK
jgi:hypothetical protein